MNFTSEPFTPALPHAPPRFRSEVRAMFLLSAPLAGAQLAQMGMGTTDTILLGSLGRDALAAGGLGASMFFFFAGLMQAACGGIGILIAHARGADDHARIAPILRAGFVLAAILTLPVIAALAVIEPLFLLIGEPPELARNVARFDRVLMAAAPAAMGLAALRMYLAAMDRPRYVLLVALGGLLGNGFLNYGLIYGAWGLPELGYLGSATATSIAVWCMLAVTALAIRWTPGLKPHFSGGLFTWSADDTRILRELIGLGWPIAITTGVEAGLFMSGSLMIGTLGTTPLAAHQVTINMAATAFMVPLAIGQAANVRVGYHNGSKLPAAARRAGLAAFLIGAAFNAAAAVLMLGAPEFLARLYQLDPSHAEDVAVIAMVVNLLAIAAFFQLVDGAQVIAAGALRGYKDTRVPMFLASFSYWVIGFPVAWSLCYPLGFGAPGVWWGLAIGLFAAAALLGWRFVRVSKN